MTLNKLFLCSLKLHNKVSKSLQIELMDFLIERLKISLKNKNIKSDVINSMLSSDDVYNLSFQIILQRINILSKKNIENYNNSGKIYVSSVEKFFQTLLSIYDFFVLLIASSKEHSKESEHQIINEEIKLNERI